MYTYIYIYTYRYVHVYIDIHMLYATIYGKSAWLYDWCFPVRFLALWQHCAMSFGLCVKQRCKRYESCAPNSCSACLARCFTLKWAHAFGSKWILHWWLQEMQIELKTFGCLPLLSLLWFGGSRLRRLETLDATQHTCGPPERFIFPKFQLGKDVLSCCAAKASSGPDHTWPQGAHRDPGGMCWVINGSANGFVQKQVIAQFMTVLIDG